MKAKFISLICILLSFGLHAAVYSPESVPNVHLADSLRFVSNPDGVLGADTQAAIDRQLVDLQRATSVEMVVVAVDDIDRDIDDFANELFTLWGVGKRDTDNGLMIILARDPKRVVIRTGQGLEGLITDADCGAIIRKVMASKFRENDYDGGISDAVTTLSTLLSSPEAAQEVRSRYANNAGAHTGDDPDFFAIYLWICAFMAVGGLAWLIIVLIGSAKEDRYHRYLSLDALYTPLLFLSFVGLGLPLVAFIPMALIRHHLRRGTHLCPGCGTKMQLMDEEHDNNFLSHAQDLEERLGAVDYDVWVCPKCDQTEIIPYVQRRSGYEECPACHARTLRVVNDRITVRPTSLRTGLRTVSYECVNCGFRDDRHITLQRKPEPSGGFIPIVGLGGGSGGGGGIGGGSFGGGLTGGGGASGSW